MESSHGGLIRRSEFWFSDKAFIVPPAFSASSSASSMENL